MLTITYTSSRRWPARTAPSREPGTIDLSLPKLRARWGGGADQLLGSGLNPSAARAVLRNVVTSVAGQAGGEQEFFEGLRGAGVEVRLRFSEITPGQVTGYSVTLPGHTGPDGTPAWYGGGRLSAALTLPQLRRQWRLRSRDGSERRDAHMPGSGAELAVFHTAPLPGAACGSWRGRWRSWVRPTAMRPWLPWS
jgi:hypothetical protein